MAYHPVTDILKANCDIRDGDRDSEIREKALKYIKRLGVDETSAVPFLLELLSVKDSGIDKIFMSPEGRKDRIMEALKRIVLKGSEIRPLIIAVEDLHWIDRSSEDVFKDLLDSIAGAKVFLIFTYRPEFVHTWGRKSFHSQVNLNKLSTGETLAMARHFLGVGDIDEYVEQFILEKTEGVPFFIEEFIRSIRDLKIIEEKDNKFQMAKDIQGVNIPSTIQDVIMARVDSLPECAKEVLQTGSVIEREFSYELIKKVTGLSKQALLSHLSSLLGSELVYERGIFPQTTYIFKHALIREVIYNSLLTERKSRLHMEIGLAIESIYQDSLVEYYEILAAHFIKGGYYERGALYSKLAHRKVVRTSAPIDAVQYAKQRIMCLERLEQSEEIQKEIINARTSLGLTYIQFNYNNESKEAIGPIYELVMASDDKNRKSQIYTVIGTYQVFIDEDLERGFDSLNQALILSDEIGDIVSNLQAHYWLGLASNLICEFESGESHLNQVLEMNIAAKSLWGISALRSVIRYFVYFLNGKIDRSEDYTVDSIDYAEKSGDIYSRAMAHISRGTSCFGAGRFDDAVYHLLKGINLCEKCNFLSWNQMGQLILIEIYFETGQADMAKKCAERAVELDIHQNYARSWMNIFELGLERAQIRNTHCRPDIDHLEGIARDIKFVFLKGWTYRFLGLIYFELGSPGDLIQSETLLKNAALTDSGNHMMFNLAMDYLSLGRLYRLLEDYGRATLNLEKAAAVFKEAGAEGWVDITRMESDALR